MKKSNRFGVIGIVGALVFVLFLVNVFVAILASSRGAEVVENERELAKLVRENRKLQSEISEGASLTRLGEQAESLDFIQPERIIYYNTEKPFASR